MKIADKYSTSLILGKVDILRIELDTRVIQATFKVGNSQTNSIVYQLSKKLREVFDDMEEKLGVDTNYLYYFRRELQEKIIDFIMDKIIQAQNETLEKQVTIDFKAYQCEIENFIQELIEWEVKNEQVNQNN